MLKMGDFVLADFVKESTDSSSKRLILVLSGVSMALGVIILCIASFFTTINAELLWALTIPLSGMAGYSYSSVEKEKIKLAQTKASLAKANNGEQVLPDESVNESTQKDNG